MKIIDMRRTSRLSAEDLEGDRVTYGAQQLTAVQGDSILRMEVVADEGERASILVTGEGPGVELDAEGAAAVVAWLRSAPIGRRRRTAEEVEGAAQAVAEAAQAPIDRD